MSNVFRTAITREIENARQQAKEYGWRFTDRTVDRHTIGDFISAVLAVDNEQDAAAFYDGYVAFLEVAPDRTEPADSVARANIGWCFGEGMTSDRVQIWRQVCNASHPVFGVANPTPTEAFEAGIRYAKRQDGRL